MGNKEQIKKNTEQIMKMKEDIDRLYDFIDQLKEVAVSLHESSKNHADMLTDVYGALVQINDKFKRLNTINDLQAVINEQLDEKIEALEEKVKE